MYEQHNTAVREIRRAGRRRITDHLRHIGGLRTTTTIDALVESALTAAQRQHVTVPGEAVAADLVRDLAAEALTCRGKQAELDKRITTVPAEHPDAALIQSLPEMGATLTAEFLAVAGGITRFPAGDQLASAAGLAPALRQSGKAAHYLRRATSGDKTIKWRSAHFCP